MRNTLEHIELIEKYLNGELSITEKLTVEKKLQDDLEFKNQLTTQQDLYKAINRVALRKEIYSVIKPSGSFGLGKWIVGGLIILVAGISLFYFSNTNKTSNAPVNIANKEIVAVKKENTTNTDNVNDETTVITSTDEVVAKKDTTNSISSNTKLTTVKPLNKSNCYDFGGLKTWVEPTIQTYNVVAEKGQLIEAENGTLITVPSNAFVNEEGKLISGTVQLKIVEAINLEDIVLYNLGTTSDGKPLQTGGMIHLEYESNGKQVNVNPTRPIYVQIPTTKVKKDMQVFEGEIANGKVNWKNPQPLKKYLINMDFNLLDFLPQGFTNAVSRFIPYKKHLSLNKTLVDSLYYSLYFGSNNDNETVQAKKMKNSSRREDRSEVAMAPDTVKRKQEEIRCGINPLSIKTIKTNAFEKTFLATKEFEERAKQLHALEKGDELINIYINNLGKDLCFSDSLVAKQLKGNDQLKFKAFEEEKLTNIKDAAIYQEFLSNYFNTKQKEFLKAQQQLEKAFETLRKEEIQKLIDEYTKTITQNGNVFSKSFKNAVQQNVLSASTSTSLYYSFTWAKSGWVNIDAYLHILSKGSQKVKMNLSGNRGETEVYQYLNEISNLTPLELKENTAFALVPKAGSEHAAKMQNTYCMAISKDGDSYKWFDQKYNPYLNTEININLEDSDINYIRKKLRVYGVQKDLIVRLDEIKKAEEENARIERERIKNFEAFKATLQAKQAAMLKDETVIKSLRKVAFKCESNYTDRGSEILNLNNFKLQDKK